MGTIVKIKDSFGGINETMDVISRATFMLENNKVLGLGDSEIKESWLRSEIKSRIGGIASKAIDDFENQQCQKKIAQQSGNSGQNPEKSGRDLENAGTTGKSGERSENSARNIKFSHLIVISIQLIQMF